VTIFQATMISGDLKIYSRLNLFHVEYARFLNLLLSCAISHPIQEAFSDNSVRQTGSIRLFFPILVYPNYRAAGCFWTIESVDLEWIETRAVM
jgi:hypothetical protein